MKAQRVTGVFPTERPPRRVSETRSPAAANGRANRNCLEHNDISDDLTVRQADRLTRLYAITYATACTIATLAYGVAR